MADHIHVQEPVAVQLVDDVLRRDANGADEELRAGEGHAARAARDHGDLSVELAHENS